MDRHPADESARRGRHALPFIKARPSLSWATRETIRPWTAIRRMNRRGEAATPYPFLMHILGISALYHDSAAAMLRDGVILGAAQEERFSRKKHDDRMPRHAIRYCLREAGLKRGDRIEVVAFYDKPITKFTRLLTTLGETAPRGFGVFRMAVPAWVKEKAWPGLAIERILREEGIKVGRFEFPEHHDSHAASAFFPSPFEEAAVITADGVGEWTTSSIGVGEGNRLRTLAEQRFPHSLGLLYSAFTHFTGFKVNSGEYKLMGLAPYGEPRFTEIILQELVELREDGSIWMNPRYFGFLDGFEMTNDAFAGLFGGPARKPESPITKREMDLAASVQVVTELAMRRMARYARAITGKPNLCLAGGVALNCVANGKILRDGTFDRIWIQPASGDAGGALGAALHVWHESMQQPRRADGIHDSMQAAALGPAYPADLVRSFLEENAIPFHEMNAVQRSEATAAALADEKVVGWFQGRMEFGPRALGRRSILADARSAKMQSHLNLATKFRESFRPFAPIVLAEDTAEYFECVTDSPYMLLVDLVRAERRMDAAAQSTDDLSAWVNQVRSDIPAVTHVDGSARIQTVDRVRNPELHDLLLAFKRMTGSSVLVNTSFNVRSEPIVCTPKDAYACFMRTGMDLLVLGDFLLWKSEQPPWQENDAWRDEFGLD